MYKSFTIKNYRCFTNLTINPLERINLIAGKNNIGKTAMLEALWLHQGYYNPELGLRLSAFRGMERFKKNEFLWDLFSGFDPEKTIELSSQDIHGQSASLRITIQEQVTSRISLRNGEQKPENGRDLLTVEKSSQETTEAIEADVFFDYTDSVGESAQAHAFVERDSIWFERPHGIKKARGIFQPARHRDNLEVLTERFSNLAVTKKETKIIKILQVIEPRLQNLTVQHRGGTSMIYGDIGEKRLMPLPLMGDGIGSLLSIALAISDAQAGILLIDEVENGLHYTVMDKVWQAIADLAREYTVQIFATTHNEECIRAAHRAFAAGKQYDFALHRLERSKGIIRAIAFNQETLEAAIEMDAEVR